MNPTTDPVSKARAQLLLESKPTAAFLATLAMQLRLAPSRQISTMCTDGNSLWYNPEFAASLPAAQLQAVVAHEVLHCALLHVFRRGTRDPELYNIAADYVVNNELTSWGFQLPAGCYCNAQYKGMSVEQVYAQLAAKGGQQPQQGGKGAQAGASGGKEKAKGQHAAPNPSGKGGGNPQLGSADAPSDAPAAVTDGIPQPPDSVLPGCPTGDFVDAPRQQSDGTGPAPMTAEDWSIMAEQAAMAARLAGTMPGGASMLIKAARQTEVDWREELRQYVTQSVPSGESWSKPNRRFVGQGVYLPGPVKERIGELVVVQDTSGSMWGRLLEVCGEQIRAIVEEVRPERVTLLHVDTRVAGVEEYEPGDSFQLVAKGGGGTYFQPAFDWLEQECRNPLAIIYLTDLENGDRGRLQEPACPVIWVTPKWITAQPEFGNVVRVDV